MGYAKLLAELQSSEYTMANAFQFRSLLGMGSEETIKSTKSEAHAAPSSSMRADRSAQVRGNLDVLMRQIEHARRDADQMIEEISALEVEAGQVADVQRENAALREQLDNAARELSAEVAKAENDAREIVRLKEELSRIRQEYEKSEREASANAMQTSRVEDRLRATITALDEAKRDLETQREAREKAELDAACLRTNLTERDRAQSALAQSETELRMQNAKLQSQYDEATEALARKERVILEKSAELESSRDRIANLETNAEASREELRILGGKYSDVKVSRDARVMSLNDALDQERESHRMTRKLLEEERMRNEELSDEIATLKEQTMMSTKDTQMQERELSAVRSQLHEYSDKLKESHLHYAAAQSDIQRLENSLEDARKEALSLQQQASKSDQILRENTDLHDKIANMQRSLERYRGTELLDDAPIMLSPTKRSSATQAKKTKVNAVASSTPNVARIRRR